MRVAQLCQTLRPHGLYSPWNSLCDPMDYTIHGTLQARMEQVTFPFSRHPPNPGIKPKSLTLWIDSLPAKPQRKPKNTRVGSLSLLQGIFLTQESNQGVLHCRWVFYELNYQGSPKNLKYILFKKKKMYILKRQPSISFGERS